MFQLIVAVISIALVAALALASIFYGGDAFTRSSEKANVTTLVNQGQQISGAVQLFKTDNSGSLPADIAALVTGNYLASEPTPSKIATGPWIITTDENYAAVPFATGLSAAAITALCASDNATTVGVDESGEIIKQNGACIDAAGAAGTTHFGFPL